VKVYVGNLPFSASGEELRALFEAYGEVTSATVVTDRETGRSRGFGFVEMGDDNARRAIEALNNHDMGGRPLVVNEARPREEGGPRRGGGGGNGRGGGGGGGGGGGRRPPRNW
jgi:RNA recognition motif-containing protein